jgi:hypothetical protein
MISQQMDLICALGDIAQRSLSGCSLCRGTHRAAPRTGIPSRAAVQGIEQGLRLNTCTVKQDFELAGPLKHLLPRLPRY